jgi:hypothetical protein
MRTKWEVEPSAAVLPSTLPEIRLNRCRFLTAAALLCFCPPRPCCSGSSHPGHAAQLCIPPTAAGAAAAHSYTHHRRDVRRQPATWRVPLRRRQLFLSRCQLAAAGYWAAMAHAGLHHHCCRSRDVARVAGLPVTWDRCFEWSYDGDRGRNKVRRRLQVGTWR